MDRLQSAVDVRNVFQMCKNLKVNKLFLKQLQHKDQVFPFDLQPETWLQLFWRINSENVTDIAITAGQINEVRSNINSFIRNIIDIV